MSGIIQNNRLVSLWDMLRFYADKFVAVLDDISALRVMGVQEPDKSFRIDDLFKKRVSDLADHLAAMKVPLSLNTVKKIMAEYESAMSGAKLDFLLAELQTRLTEELEQAFLFQIPPGKSDYYEISLGKWSRITDKHPQLIEDIDEAGKCLSLGRYTAATFHLMRAMEHHLQNLAEQMGVTVKRGDTWHVTSNNLAAKINREWPCNDSSLTDQNKEIRQQCNEVLAYLANVKLAWRNEVAHPKSTYTAEEAENIYSAALAFMNSMLELSEKMPSLAHAPNPQ